MTIKQFLKEASEKYEVPYEIVEIVYDEAAEQIRNEVCQLAPVPRHLKEQEIEAVVLQAADYVTTASMGSKILNRIYGQFNLGVGKNDQTIQTHILTAGEVVGRTMLYFRFHGKREVVMKVGKNEMGIQRIHPPNRPCFNSEKKSVLM